MSISKIVMNSDEAAKKLGLSNSTLAKMRVYGRGPQYLKLGRRVVYSLADLEAWLNENRHRSTSEYDTPGEQK